MKFKSFAGWILICLVSACAASALTALLLLRGLIGVGGQTAGTTSTLPGTTTASSSASQSETAATTVKPQSTPTPTPITTPTKHEPTPAVNPASSIDALAMSVIEQYYFWQTRDLLENIYAMVSPSVVGIKIEVSGSSSTKLTNEGSGIVISAQGDIMTNAGLLAIAIDKGGKVMAGASIQVFIQGIYRPFSASLIGRDLMTGLAVIHINPEDFVLHPAAFADKPDLKVGQRVLAIGYPEQLYNAGCLTNGIISGLNYPVVLEEGTTMRMIQTDTPVSSSCAGGPLLNLLGEVIGITSEPMSPAVNNQMTYALPGTEALRVCLNLIEKGYVPGRSWLGVNVLSEESFLDLKSLYNLPDGLFISGIVSGSPAASVDLRKGDVITKIDKTTVTSPNDLYRILQGQPVGTLVVITVYRRSDGRTHDIEVYLQEYVS